MKTLIKTNNEIELSDIEQIIYDLLFSDKRIFNINLEKYCSFENRAMFRDEIRNVITRGGIKTLDDRIIHTNESVIWKLELKK